MLFASPRRRLTIGAVILTSCCAVVSVSPDSGGEWCSDDKSAQNIADCLRPMVAYADEIQKRTGGAELGLPLNGLEIFEKLCQLYFDFKKCTSETANCRNKATEAIESSYGFMCGKGKSAFSEHVNCFTDIETNPKYLLCKNAATGVINELKLTQKQLRDDSQKLCSVMFDYLSCSRPIIVDKCGSTAWDLVRQVTETSLKVTMPNCDLSNAFNY